LRVVCPAQLGPIHRGGRPGGRTRSTPATAVEVGGKRLATPRASRRRHSASLRGPPISGRGRREAAREERSTRRASRRGRASTCPGDSPTRAAEYSVNRTIQPSIPGLHHRPDDSVSGRKEGPPNQARHDGIGRLSPMRGRWRDPRLLERREKGAGGGRRTRRPTTKARKMAAHAGRPRTRRARRFSRMARKASPKGDRERSAGRRGTSTRMAANQLIIVPQGRRGTSNGRAGRGRGAGRHDEPVSPRSRGPFSTRWRIRNMTTASVNIEKYTRVWRTQNAPTRGQRRRRRPPRQTAGNSGEPAEQGAGGVRGLRSRTA